jgi:hypothetical protein
MEKSPVSFLAGALLAFLSLGAAAMDGKHVVTVGGKMQLSTIQRNSVSSSQTINDFTVASPEFNFDGTKVVCWKNSGSKWYLSVMDVSSRTFSDLVDITATWNVVPGGERIHWPAGEWIYLERPSLTGEIWRVNSLNASQMANLFDYTNTDQRLYSFFLTADAKKGLIDINGFAWDPQKSGMYIHNFPPANGDASRAPALIFQLPNCNGALSPSASFSGRFLDGDHQDMVVYQWSASKQTYEQIPVGSREGSINSMNDIELWSGTYGWAGKIDGPRWAVNSDRWLTIHADNEMLANGTGNSVAFSWVEKASIVFTNNVTSTSGGSIFVGGGPAGCCQNIDGKWISVATGQEVDAKIKPVVDTLRISAEFGGPNPPDQAVDFTIGAAGPSNPRIVAFENAPWLTVAVQTTRAQNTVDISGLPSGYHHALVTLDGDGMATGAYVVQLKVNSAPAVSSIVITPSSALVPPNGTEQFSAKVFDQFGALMTTPVIWSVSGGGAVSTTGLFTAGAAAWNSKIFATIGSSKDSARVDIGNGCALPSGLFKELLCLEEADNFPYIYRPHGALLETQYIGSGAHLPAEGDRVVVNGTTYTWRVRRHEDGLWAAGPRNRFSAYWFLTVISSAQAQVKISARHDDDVTVWNDGAQAAVLPGWSDGASEQLTSAFTLRAGENHLFFRLNDNVGGNLFAARIVNESGSAMSGLNYYPCYNPASTGAPGSTLKIGNKASIRIISSREHIRIVPGTPGNHRIDLLNAQGQRVRAEVSQDGLEVVFDRKDMHSGVYIAQVRSGESVESVRILIR